MRLAVDPLAPRPSSDKTVHAKIVGVLQCCGGCKFRWQRLFGVYSKVAPRESCLAVWVGECGFGMRRAPEAR
eukprot:6832340-Pyramimonas_sp.AAC.1